MRILAPTRMGRIRVWDVPYAYGISRTRMGQYYVPYEYMHALSFIAILHALQATIFVY